MTPILFDKFQRSPTANNGYGILTECTRCIVTEELNGIYECEFDYPMSGVHFDRLITGEYAIGITHNHNGDIQMFDINRYSAPIEGVVSFFGTHVSYRLFNQICKGQYDNGTYPSVNSMGQLLNYITRDDYTLVVEPAIGGFNASNQSTVDAIGTFYFPLYANSRYLLMNREETELQNANGTISFSVLQKFGGEFKFDNFLVLYYDKRGSIKPVQIRYGKNMTDVEREFDAGSIVSRLYPFFVGNGTGDVEETVRVIYSPVTSPNFYHVRNDWTTQAGNIITVANGEPLEFNTPDIRSAVFDLSEMFDTYPSSTDAMNAALNYMSKNSTWRPYDNITVEFLDLFDSPEYENVKDLQKCSLGDFVSVYYAELGIVAENVEIISTTYDALSERFTEMQLNSMRSTLSQVIRR